jgi:hypothetical protein
MRTNPSRWRASRRGLASAADASSLLLVVMGEDMIWSRFGAQRSTRKGRQAPLQLALKIDADWQNISKALSALPSRNSKITGELSNLK